MGTTNGCHSGCLMMGPPPGRVTAEDHSYLFVFPGSLAFVHGLLTRLGSRFIILASTSIYVSLFLSNDEVCLSLGAIVLQVIRFVRGQSV